MCDFKVTVSGFSCIYFLKYAKHKNYLSSEPGTIQSYVLFPMHRIILPANSLSFQLISFFLPQNYKHHIPFHQNELYFFLSLLWSYSITEFGQFSALFYKIGPFGKPYKTEGSILS